MEGVFVAGAAAGPKDIVDTITESGAAAMEAANYLERTRPIPESGGLVLFRHSGFRTEPGWETSG
jgi:hypothetical protein